jgi:hypothetical protein
LVFADREVLFGGGGGYMAFADGAIPGVYGPCSWLHLILIINCLYKLIFKTILYHKKCSNPNPNHNNPPPPSQSPTL